MLTYHSDRHGLKVALVTPMCSRNRVFKLYYYDNLATVPSIFIKPTAKRLGLILVKLQVSQKASQLTFVTRRPLFIE